MEAKSVHVLCSAQLCVYVGEEKVVDLWGSVKDKVGVEHRNILPRTSMATVSLMCSVLPRCVQTVCKYMKIKTN